MLLYHKKEIKQISNYKIECSFDWFIQIFEGYNCCYGCWTMFQLYLSSQETSVSRETTDLPQVVSQEEIEPYNFNTQQF